MNMEMPEKGKILFELSESDLEELGITFEELDYSNIETRRVVWTLLDAAKKNFDAEFDITGKMLIEVFPKIGRNGGCTLVITSDPREPEFTAAKPQKIKRIYEFQNADSLLAFARQLSAFTPPERGGELYSKGTKLRLVIELGGNQKRLVAALNEYACEKPSDDVSISYTLEHWDVLVKSGALEAITLGCAGS